MVQMREMIWPDQQKAEPPVLRNQVQMDIWKRHFKTENPSNKEIEKWMEQYRIKFNEIYERLFSNSDPNLKDHDKVMYDVKLEQLEEELY